jgi:hypothetical protein
MLLGVQAHFFLAPFAPISDNPALTKSAAFERPYPDGSRTFR